MGILDQGVRNLQQAGVVDILLPFILVFAITFGILQKIEIFGKDQSKKFNVLIALVAGLIPVFNHVLYPGSRIDIVPMINNAFPQISLILIAIVALLLILGLFGMKVKGAQGWFANVIIFGSIIAVALIFGSSAGLGWWNLPYWMRGILNGETVSIIVAILIFAIVIGYITGDDKDKKDKEERSKEFRNNPAKFFGLD